MNVRIGAVIVAVMAGGSFVAAAEPDSRVFEMRTYYAHEGKLDALQARFRDHTTKLFEKHGMTNVGYWTPIDNPDQKLIYVLSYPNRDAAKKSWSAFVADADWKKARAESEKAGPLVKKAESVYMQLTDYSAAPQRLPSGDNVFELRVYTASKGNLGNLNARFRNHTVKLFEKHGMTNVAYWTPVAGQKGADDTLIYILAHKSVDAAKTSFGAFRQDPDWLAVRKASEEKAGGSLTEKDGVKSTFMKATDYSSLK
jgi:hypothetical protein